MIESYFKNYTNIYHSRNMALKRYIEAKEDFASLSGVSYDKVNVQGGKPQEFADIMIKIDYLYNDFLLKDQEYNEERIYLMNQIERMNNPIHKAIIEYKYLDQKDDAEITVALKKYNGLDYSVGYVYKLTTKAKEDFIKNTTISKNI